MTGGSKLSVTLTDVTELYGCLDSTNTVQNGQNKFLYRDSTREYFLEWEDNKLYNVSSNNERLSEFTCAAGHGVYRGNGPTNRPSKQREQDSVGSVNR